MPFERSTPIVRGSLHIYEMERIVILEGVELDLTPKEYELLLLLASHPGRAFSREFLLQQLWGYDYDGFDRTVDTHITRLRKKLGTPGEKIVAKTGKSATILLQIRDIFHTPVKHTSSRTCMCRSVQKRNQNFMELSGENTCQNCFLTRINMP